MIAIIITGIGCLAVGIAGGIIYRKNIAEGKLNNAEVKALQIVEDAKKESETLKKEAIVEAKDEAYKLKNEMEQEIRARRADAQRTEHRLIQKEENLDRKTEALEKKEAAIIASEHQLAESQEKLNGVIATQMTELERISNLSYDQAKDLLLSRVESEIKHETAMIIKENENIVKEECDRRARNIISLAIQRCAADHVAEATVSVVALPNEEMKGRIIGREGRNIRTLETLTGIDLIIDDTPEAVILSGFDPVRREVARLALEKLIVDGRIHPGRIEEMVDKAKKEVEQSIRTEGEQATFETGVNGLNPELVRLLGRLKYRTSYGQNVLKHSIEVSELAGMMASEIGADVKLAKRAGLLHDIGKAIDHEVEGSHAAIGAELAKKYRESEEVIHAIAAHHGDEPFRSVEAVLVAAADAVSAARPGARRETLEAYIKRLEKLEEIANGFEGVEKSFAIQAGREVRIIVKPDKVDDAQASMMAHDIVKQIEESMEYPGQIKVVVIRETRAVDHAK